VRRARHLPGQEGHGVFVEVEDATQVVEIGHGLGRRILDGDLFAQGEDRQLRRPYPRHADQLDHVLQQPAVLPRAFGRHQNAGQAVMSGGNDTPFGGAGRGQNTEAVLGELLCDGAHTITGHGVGLDVAMHD
jgi:hypothetical protein